MIGSIGWVCPKCGAIVSPYRDMCATCAPTTKPYSGTIVMGSVTYSGLGSLVLGGSFLGSGTVYAAPPKTDAQKLEEAKADAADWRDKFERLIEAINEVIEDHQDDDED